MSKDLEKEVKTFEFRGNENCCLSVGHYPKEKSMWIAVIDADLGEEIESLTVFDRDYDYDVGLVTVCNESVGGNEIWGYKTGTEVLQELGLIEKIWKSYSCYNLKGIKNKIHSCNINLNKLAEYCYDWDFWEFEPDN